MTNRMACRPGAAVAVCMAMSLAISGCGKTGQMPTTSNTGASVAVDNPTEGDGGDSPGPNRPATPSPDASPDGATPLAAPNGGSDETLEETSARPSSSARSETAPESEPPDRANDRPADRPANRLAKETSPYLLMHAHNPVDWYPWGEEALKKAKDENKPIFLSVGYSSCHWCHVMERESFLDEEIAKLLNERFVCIKVDREERPDVDAIYMTAVQIINRHGGWPMSVFLTPDAKPFFGGTYFPARDGDREGAIGFLTILQRVDTLWRESEDRLMADADELAAMIKSEMEGARPNPLEPLGRELLGEVQSALADQFDPDFGGFNYSPVNPQMAKFPEPSNLVFLLARARDESLPQEPRDAAREMLVRTLEQMAWGGIHDHAGGGFHRYSTDRYWRIPHFEKMLYDNGQLMSVYAETFELTGNDEFRRAAIGIGRFVMREMRDEQGGFYAALDAESEDEEGRFYRWSKEEVETALGDDFNLFAAAYGLDRDPNFEDDFYVLRRRQSLADLAKEQGTTLDELTAQYDASLDKLLEVRGKRERPLTDTKVLSGWNGLMIGGLADAGRILDRPDFVDAARQAAEFMLAELRDGRGRLFRTWSHGQGSLNAYDADYAFVVDGLLALHRATKDERWLDAAAELTETQIELFWDEARGGFFFTADDHESLLARMKNPVDGAEPAGNSVAAHNLLRIGLMRGRDDFVDKARATVQSAGAIVQRAPAAAPRLAVVVGSLPEKVE